MMYVIKTLFNDEVWDHGNAFARGQRTFIVDAETGGPIASRISGVQTHWGHVTSNPANERSHP